MAKNKNESIFMNERGFLLYLRNIKNFPLLEAEEEYQLAKQWCEKRNHDAARKLIQTHLRLVVRIALGYKGYGLPLNELISEGTLGAIQALKRYDFQKGFRFSTYATWWIHASIKEYILHSWSLVKLGTTNAQKKLFFSLKKTQNLLQELEDNQERDKDLAQMIATKLAVSKQEVVNMQQRLSNPDYSLNSPISTAEDEGEWQDLIEDERDNQETQYANDEELFKRRKLLRHALENLSSREHKIFIERRLTESPPPLAIMARKYGLSRERIRQIEKEAFEKVQKSIMRKTPETRYRLSITNHTL